jgi:hypothetical protein
MSENSACSHADQHGLSRPKIGSKVGATYCKYGLTHCDALLDLSANENDLGHTISGMVL